uniref:NR LBD domain-containing protein n=1 Tax=Acrobeloides nanus TaxID=290746 RepID=A0A914CX26_9BILA
MQQLSFGFNRFYEVIRPKGGIVLATEVDRLCQFEFQEKYMIELAKMLMCCDRFASLPFEDKFSLYKNVRPIFQTLERHWSSVIYFGPSYDDWRLLHDDKTAIDFASLNLKFKNVDQEMFKKTVPLWIPIRDKNIKFLMSPMKTLQLTEYEIVFLLAHILWTVQDINGLSENAVRVSEETTEQIASELHNYYAYSMRISNYAPRLVKITRLIDAAKEIRHAKQDVWTIAKIFDMFRFEIVGSELTEL